MSAETEARDIELVQGGSTPRTELFGHLVLIHRVRIDRWRYLPGLSALSDLHRTQHEKRMP